MDYQVRVAIRCDPLGRRRWTIHCHRGKSPYALNSTESAAVPTGGTRINSGQSDNPVVAGQSVDYFITPGALVDIRAEFLVTLPQVISMVYSPG